MTSKGLQQIFATVTELPSMPASGIRMLKLLENPEASVDEIEDILMCRKNAGVGHLDEAHGELSPAVVSRLGIAENQLEAVMGKVADWVDELSDVLTFN